MGVNPNDMEKQGKTAAIDSYNSLFIANKIATGAQVSAGVNSNAQSYATFYRALGRALPEDLKVEADKQAPQAPQSPAATEVASPSLGTTQASTATTTVVPGHSLGTSQPPAPAKVLSPSLGTSQPPAPVKIPKPSLGTGKTPSPEVTAEVKTKNGLTAELNATGSTSAEVEAKQNPQARLKLPEDGKDKNPTANKEAKETAEDSYYTPHYVEMDRKADMARYLQKLGTAVPTSEHYLEYSDFIQLRRQEVKEFAELKNNYRKYRVETAKYIQAMLDGTIENKTAEQNKATAQLLKITAEEIAEVERIRDSMTKVGVSDKEDATKEEYQRYFEILADRVAKRRATLEFQNKYYGKESPITPFLFADLGKAEDLDFNTYQTWALMELYDGVSMQFEKDKSGAPNMGIFNIKYTDENDKEHILVSAKKESAAGHDLLFHSKEVLVLTADVSSNDPKVWDKALCLLVDQRKRLMNRSAGPGADFFPIEGKASPEKMLRLYQLALLQNLNPRLGKEQIKHIHDYDQKHGTNYMKTLEFMQICKASVVADRISNWQQSLKDELVNMVEVTGDDTVRDRVLTSGDSKAKELAAIPNSEKTKQRENAEDKTVYVFSDADKEVSALSYDYKSPKAAKHHNLVEQLKELNIMKQGKIFQEKFTKPEHATDMPPLTTPTADKKTSGSPNSG